MFERQTISLLAGILRLVSKGVEDRLVTLEFARADRFPMSQVEKNRQAVEKFCAEKWGQELRLRCVLGGEAEPEKTSKKQEKPQDDPTIKAVLDAFDGEII